MTGTLTPRRPADSIRLSNLELIKNEILDLPDAFYGVLELHFHKGALMHLKTISSKKFNSEAKSPETAREQAR